MKECRQLFDLFLRGCGCGGGWGGGRVRRVMRVDAGVGGGVHSSLRYVLGVSE